MRWLLGNPGAPTVFPGMGISIINMKLAYLIMGIPNWSDDIFILRRSPGCNFRCVIVKPISLFDNRIFLCQGFHWWYVNIDSGNGLMPSGNKPLPEPMLIDQFLWRHMASLGANELNFWRWNRHIPGKIEQHHSHQPPWYWLCKIAQRALVIHTDRFQIYPLRCCPGVPY